METNSEIVVRYAETDKMGIVHHSNYYVWFEIGRTDLCRAAGFSYTEMENEDNLRLVVAESSCRYVLPAFYEDVLSVQTRVERIRSRGLTFSYEISRSGKTIARGKTVHIVTDHEGRTTKMPEKYVKLLSNQSGA